MVKTNNQKINSQIKPEIKEFNIIDYYKQHYDEKTFQDAFKLFSGRETPLTDVAKQYNIDKRTIKKV